MRTCIVYVYMLVYMYVFVLYFCKEEWPWPIAFFRQYWNVVARMHGVHIHYISLVDIHIV